MHIHLTTLGCSKNLVDSEMMLGYFARIGAKQVSEPEDADFIIINTCGFIAPAKEEAIATILAMVDFQKEGKKIIVTGCMVERYLDELKKEIPEVDAFIPLRDYHAFGEALSTLLPHAQKAGLTPLKRVLTTPSHLAYVKIAEGCSNRCHYCAIPLIRGSFHSRPLDEIMDEVDELVKKGVKEIVFISQDTTRYGTDLGLNLETLLESCLQIAGDYRFRLLYLYPDDVSVELLSLMKREPRIIPYFDIPIQHAVDHLLQSMGRRSTKQSLIHKINQIRDYFPKATLRTTIIVGYPGETNEDFEALLEFIMTIGFDRLGAFTFSPEEDTKAFALKQTVSYALQQERLNRLNETQLWISLAKNSARIGDIVNVLIDGYDEERKAFIARDDSFAPDDIDGCIYIPSSQHLKTGQPVKVIINDAEFYALHGEVFHE